MGGEAVLRAVGSAEAQSNLIVTITGKIMRQKREGDRNYTVFALAAVDEFTRPDQVEVRSERALGADGSILTIRAKLGGYGARPFETRPTQRNGGEIKLVRPIVHTLDHVE